MKSLIKTLIFTLIVPGTVVVIIPYGVLSSRPELHEGFGLIGFLPITTGAAFYFWCAWDFATFGKGTPATIDPPKQLVVRGLYRWVRNPMYVGVLLVVSGESIVWASPLVLGYALLLWLLFHLFVVLNEEPALKRQFGASYEHYCSAVSRWPPHWPRADRA